MKGLNRGKEEMEMDRRETCLAERGGRERRRGETGGGEEKGKL